MAEILEVEQSPELLAEIGQLFREYARGEPDRLCFDDLEREIRGLPQPFAPPAGTLLLARDSAGPVGCIGLCPAADGGEIRRLYIRRRARGRGLGRQLAEAVLAAAPAVGHEQVTLVTRSHMRAAVKLYVSLGFRPVPPPPGEGTASRLWMAKRLAAPNLTLISERS